MRLPRPYVPLGVRLSVALRQLGTPPSDIARLVETTSRNRTLDANLYWVLKKLFNTELYHLDHDPALENRLQVKNTRTGKIRYVPDANDPRSLIYRTKEDHRLKTLVRGDGAQLSDAAIARKRKRKERKATRPKYNWPSRPLQSRSSFR